MNVLFKSVLLTVAGLITLGALSALESFIPAPAPHVPSDEELSAADRRTAATAAVDVLRRSLRDPDSLVIESVFTKDPTRAVCIAYRARNGFGGMNRTGSVVMGAKLSSDVSIWNRECAGKGFRDVSLFGL